MNTENIIPIGAKINVEGIEQTVTGVMFIGERYYSLQDKKGTVSLIPSSTLQKYYNP